MGRVSNKMVGPQDERLLCKFNDGRNFVFASTDVTMGNRAMRASALSMAKESLLQFPS